MVQANFSILHQSRNPYSALTDIWGQECPYYSLRRKEKIRKKNHKQSARNIINLERKEIAKQYQTTSKSSE